MLTKDEVLNLRDLALDHMPKTRELRDKVRRDSGNSKEALRVVAGAPDAILCSVESSTIERRAAVLLALVQQHPDALVEWLNEPAPCNDDFPGQLEQILANDAQANRLQTESLMLETARKLCHISGAKLPPWMMPIEPTIGQTAKTIRNVSETPVIRRKRSALISELVCIWPSIDRDLSDATRNGLNLAKSLEHGYWDLTKAVSWAVERGKIPKQKAKQSVANNPDSIFAATLRQLFSL